MHMYLCMYLTDTKSENRTQMKNKAHQAHLRLTPKHRKVGYIMLQYV